MKITVSTNLHGQPVTKIENDGFQLSWFQDELDRFDVLITDLMPAPMGDRHILLNENKLSELSTLFLWSPYNAYVNFFKFI